MALSEKAKRVLKQAMANDPEQDAILAELEKVTKIDAAAAVAAIATPATATTEDVANKVNELLAALS